MIRTCILLIALAAACGDRSKEISQVHERAVAPRATFSLPKPVEKMPAVFRWTLPEGWEEVPATKLRLANFRIARDPATECYLTVLAGGGGGLAANVDRWRQQMGLAPMPQGEVEALPERALLGLPARFIDLEGDFSGMGTTAAKGYRLLGLVAEARGQAMFLKMVGPAATVGAEVENFTQLAASLRMSIHHTAHGGGGTPAAANALAWTKPDGWEQKPARRMRIVTFAPANAADTECFVAELGGDGGGTLANVNRWRAQLGQPPLTSDDRLETLQVLGTTATFVEVEGTYRGMGEANLAGAALLGLVCDLNGNVLFVKMTGPRAVVLREKKNFVQFCESLRLSS